MLLPCNPNSKCRTHHGPFLIPHSKYPPIWSILPAHNGFWILNVTTGLGSHYLCQEAILKWLLILRIPQYPISPLLHATLHPYCRICIPKLNPDPSKKVIEHSDPKVRLSSVHICHLPTMTLGKPPVLSTPQFPHLYSGNTISTFKVAVRIQRAQIYCVYNTCNIIGDSHMLAIIIISAFIPCNN